MFESGYAYLALTLNAPELCERISPQAVEHGPIFGDRDKRIRYLQSICFYDLAIHRGDPSLCARVRTISRPFRDGSGISEALCRGRASAGRSSMGGNYGTGILLGVMGFNDDAIRAVYPDHPAPDRSYDFLSRLTFGRERVDLTPRIGRLPDFSRGDAQAIRDLDAVMPQCADRRAITFECRRLRCALVRAQAGDLGCERALERERSPWD